MSGRLFARTLASGPKSEVPGTDAPMHPLDPVDVKRAEAAFATCELRPPRDGDIAAALSMAQARLDAQICSLETALDLQTLTRVCFWVGGDPIDTLMIVVPLSPQGVLALQSGTYTPREPASDHVAKLGQPCAGAYCALLVGQTPRARARLVKAGDAMRRGIGGHLPIFARSASRDGARLLKRFGYQPLPGPLENLWYQPGLPLKCRPPSRTEPVSPSKTKPNANDQKGGNTGGR